MEVAGALSVESWEKKEEIHWARRVEGFKSVSSIGSSWNQKEDKLTCEAISAVYGHPRRAAKPLREEEMQGQSSNSPRERKVQVEIEAITSSLYLFARMHRWE